MAYTENTTLNDLIESAVESVTSGSSNETLTVMIKKSPTKILLASSQHIERRYQPGAKLVTYNGIDAQGNPIQETWGGGVAVIKDNSVILSNVNPLTYPEGHELAGQEVKGDYNEDGEFVVDQQNGNTTLFT